MSSALIEVFNDFAVTTKSHAVTGPEVFVNEAARRSYLIRKFVTGNDMKTIIQSGSRVRDYLMFDEQSTRQPYRTGAETFTWSNPQVIEFWETDWRFFVDHLSYTENEIELQAGDSANPVDVFKRIMRAKEMRLATSTINGMEDGLFRVPVVSEMTGITGNQANSIPLFVTEYATGLFDPQTSPPFTDVMGISPVTEPRWDNQRATYIGADASDTATGIPNLVQRLFSAFDQMFYTTRKDTLPGKEQYAEAPTLSDFIACSLKGINLYQKLLRFSQDTFVQTGRQDPAYPYPHYAGIELVYVQTLDTADLYLLVADTSRGTETTAEIAGPRYYWLNGDHLKMIFHKNKIMQRSAAIRHPNQPFTWVVPTDTYMQLYCSSRQRQGIVSPITTDVTNF